MNELLDIKLPEDPFNIYVIGSRSYGCNNDQSDFDFIVVTPTFTSTDTLIHNNINVTSYSISDFKKKIEEHEISVLECLWLPQNKVIREQLIISYELDLKKLRSSLSAKASNSWVKAKKKFEVEHEYYIARKSLFHSLRILTFGIQIANNGKIIDYTAANKYWTEIMNFDTDEWRVYKQKYKPIYNELKTQFGLVAPK